MYPSCYFNYTYFSHSLLLVKFPVKKPNKSPKSIVRQSAESKQRCRNPFAAMDEGIQLPAIPLHQL